ncbi:phytanoyl-CoA dioxygenase family protein [Dietzia lutea]|uniref:Phytanoyl-CoA dioxygenase n=1 Tax=Dietzia lutea TaxID=546160 RepID=A0A2S1R3U9_9ACTN|nr:phytanoyl-CoA dioxygenase family protein [Dietzia lutea]AWH90935.1 phytanoyl-CoA dioxygenase [Dietzia lutea]
MTGITAHPGIAHVSRDTPVADIMEIFQRDGGVVIKQFVTGDQIEAVNQEVEPQMAALAAGSTHDDEFAAAFHGANTKRLTNLVTHSAAFRQLLDDDLLHNLCEVAFADSGSFHINSQQLIEIGPNSDAQLLHRDLENWWPFVGMGPAGPEVVVNFLVALTDFTEEMGATRVIPGSNHWSDFSDRGTPEQTVPAVMRAGDALFFSGKTAHGGGANATSDAYRRGLALSLCPGFLVGEEAYPFIVDMDVARQLPARVQRLIDFRSHYPTGSPGLWQVDYSELADYLQL